MARTFSPLLGEHMTATYALLYFRSMPDNILTKMEEEVLDLAKTYPQAIALLEPVREFCLHMEEQSEKQLKAMAIELGLAPFLYDPDATESNIGYEATRENMAEIQAIIGMVEEGYQFILKTPMRYLEYVAGMVFEEDSEAIKRFLSMKTLKDAKNHRPILALGYQAEPNEIRQKCLNKVLMALRGRDTKKVWDMRYVAKFMCTSNSVGAERWIEGLYAATTFTHVVNLKNPKAVWEQLCSSLPLDISAFFGNLGNLSEKEQTELLDEYLKKTLN